MNKSSAYQPPSRWWYLLAVFVFLAGFLVIATFLWPRIMAMGDQLTQIVVPGEAELRLDKPGTYTIFHEKRSIVDGEVFVSETIDGLRITVTTALTDAPVPLVPASVGANYSIGGREGASLFTFEIDQPGKYRIGAGYDDGRNSPRAVLAVGHGFLDILMETIFGALAIAFGGVALAITIAYVTWRKRRRARG